MAGRLRSLRSALLVGTATLCAHSAPAKATRPLVQASGALDAVRLSTPRELREVLSGQVTGLEREAPRAREHLMSQAKRFRAYRLGRGATRDAFLKKCDDTKAGDDVFCRIEAEILSEKATAALSKTRAAREDGRVVAAALRSADLPRLETYSMTELSGGTSLFSDFQDLVPIAKKVVSASGCAYPLVANALASKAEESFPDGDIVELARQLYARAGECGREPHASQARFRQGLLAIAARQHDEAEKAMRRIVASRDAGVFHARAKFWLHHLAVLAKNETRAVEMREALWRDHTLSFHSLVVNGRDERIRSLLESAPAPRVALRSTVRPEANAYIRGIEALMEIGARDLAGEIADRFVVKFATVEPEVRLYVATLMHRAGQALPKFRILTSAFQDAPRLLSRGTLEMLFPKWHIDLAKKKAKDIDPLLVLSLIRQESAFNVHAHSSAGARGLMQVMPATARSIAKVRKERLWDPSTNVEVGTKYLRHRLERYNGDVELTLAAYNAGFSRVDRWVKRYPLENKLLFMDLIPFRETREYISSILRNYFWYTQLYARNEGLISTAQVDGALEKVGRILEANAGARAPSASSAP